MKTIAKIPYELIILSEGEYIPNEIEPNKFYYSKELGASSHLCPCGCNTERFIPIKAEGNSITMNLESWNIEIKDNKFSITPSILHRQGCKSHYIITNNIANIV
jgi:hypothetical protein